MPNLKCSSSCCSRENNQHNGSGEKKQKPIAEKIDLSSFLPNHHLKFERSFQILFETCLFFHSKHYLVSGFFNSDFGYMRLYPRSICFKRMLLLHDENIHLIRWKKIEKPSRPMKEDGFYVQSLLFWSPLLSILLFYLLSHLHTHTHMH